MSEERSVVFFLFMNRRKVNIDRKNVTIWNVRYL